MNDYDSIDTGQQIDNIVGAVREKESVWDRKQNQLTGEPGQVVGFNEQGQSAPQEEGVPKDRTVNGKELSENITLTAEDAGAAPADHTHTSDGLSQDAADD